MASTDLTATVGKYLDRHMLLPLLDFLGSKKIFPDSELDAARLQVLEKTNMVDFAMEIYTKLNQGEVPAEMRAKRDEVMTALTALQLEVGPLYQIVSDGPLVANLRAERCFTPAFLLEQHSVTAEHVAALGKYAKFTYDCGNYGAAASMLSCFRLLTSSADEAFSAQWGKLACDILNGAWDAALEELGALKEAIEARSGSTPAARRSVVSDLLLSEKYLNAIQTTCPPLFVAPPPPPSPPSPCRHAVKELVRVIGMERPTYSDPVTSFLDDLYGSANFESAQERLAACAATLDSDFFLCNAEGDFVKYARLHLFEGYCRIHERIDLGSLAQKLGTRRPRSAHTSSRMERIAAEKWIVKMVSDAQLNAKIDSKSSHVILGAQPPDVYQQVIERTKGLSFRSYVLAQNLQQREQQAARAAKVELQEAAAAAAQ
ncbi:hypothetical protein EMIHUDRAFT_426559 [Emiliania huxleyi CCMP1516]|uniref:Eukaryotic translation initiation factor 3 subunit E n=2 Tax=Emiliania huxleyi TaxID=2903 RepID=A0A0D3KF39_EMIH1|nr:hypothetical protein EMIHUDRAFT_426559 [Emiliania huxleyi CCMP1516]EOD34374.1 hypothetical protein EMIHUDRAFT_426559 [Emiliania huxleyi CCMP1516]|eukprot:XP_005786803.1 hypothetical protein EMIHUDRAFT_426559 [Emiliania huxleyi CCMP1516]